MVNLMKPLFSDGKSHETTIFLWVLPHFYPQGPQPSTPAHLPATARRRFRGAIQGLEHRAAAAGAQDLPGETKIVLPKKTTVTIFTEKTWGNQMCLGIVEWNEELNVSDDSWANQ